MSPIAPCLLVASPLLLDPNFLHTVVLLIEHDEQGAMGVILNRPLPLTLAKICEESQLTFGGDPDVTAWRGGPVDPQRGIILVRGGLPAE
ncbi:MAG TPA: YqgE/AlgH family protein, partial [Holophaga sp.]|nr:YqgE/AlgH family protein [Holophaga sp.]